MGKLIDLTGKIFGKLKVLSRDNENTYINGEALWKCICLCEKKSIISVYGSCLRYNKKKSCGCIWKPSDKEFLYKTQLRLVQNSKMNGQCLEWTGFRDKNGYGHICITRNGKEKPMGAHRASWMIYKGEIPSGLFVCHKCDNPSCIRIEHLFLGTAQDNMTDKMNKNRGNFKKGPKNRGNFKKGSEKSNSKLTESQAKEILDMKGKNKSSHEICKEYGIAASTVRQIWQRKSWKHI